MMKNDNYLIANGIDYRGTIQKSKKSSGQLTPLYEALTNSLEAIRTVKNSDHAGQITIALFKNKRPFADAYDFECLQIKDNGIGFTNEDFMRMRNLNNSTKGFNNKGTGRIQFILLPLYQNLWVMFGSGKSPSV